MHEKSGWKMTSGSLTAMHEKSGWKMTSGSLTARHENPVGR
jgi:hypothetical protein